MAFTKRMKKKSVVLKAYLAKRERGHYTDTLCVFTFFWVNLARVKFIFYFFA